MTRTTRSPALPTPRLRYARCDLARGGRIASACGHADCPRCDPRRAFELFSAEGREGGAGRALALPPRPVLIYHVPRSGGSFLAEVLERLEVAVLRPDLEGEADATSELLRTGARRGLVIFGHTAAAVKARHPDVEFDEYGACWRDPFEISASEFHGIRDAEPGHHLFEHHLRAECLACDSVADWVERFARTNPISAVLSGNRPEMLRASHYAADVADLLKRLFGRDVDLVADFGFRPEALRPGQWVQRASRQDLLRLRELHAEDYALGAALGRRAALQRG